MTHFAERIKETVDEGIAEGVSKSNDTHSFRTGMLFLRTAYLWFTTDQAEREAKEQRAREMTE